MFKTVHLPCGQRRLPRLFQLSNSASKRKHHFSIVSVHSKFPATLFRYQRSHRSGLIESSKSEDQGGSNDRVLVSPEGYVHPFVATDFTASNGARFMPNTFLMQELMRMHLDYYIEDVENGIKIEEPSCISIRKGTSIPDSLILFRECSSHFSLQPSKPMSLKALNDTLDEFYSKHASIEGLNEWLSKHEYNDAVVDSATESWMQQ